MLPKSSAFPVPEKSKTRGIEVRGYLAAMVMQGDWAADEGFSNNVGQEFLLERAELYYRMADAMIEVSKRKP